MTAEGWRNLVVHSVDDPESLDLLVRLLVEVDDVKAKLNDAGIAWTGRRLSDTIDEMIRERTSW